LAVSRLSIFKWKAAICEKFPYPIDIATISLYFLCEFSRRVCPFVPGFGVCVQALNMHQIEGIEPTTGLINGRRSGARNREILGWQKPASIYIRAANAGPRGNQTMSSVTLSATPKGNGFQATVTFANGVSISSAEAFPTKSEAISAAALKLLGMPERLEGMDAPDETEGQVPRC
jgi:hypothetical protein